MVEFYIKSLVTEQMVQDGQLEEYDPIEIYLSQIKMVLSTNTKVMGAADMNLNLEDEVYNYNVDEVNLQRKILEKILNFCPLSTDFPTTVSVKFMKGTNRDTVLIDIVVNGERNLQVFLS